MISTEKLIELINMLPDIKSQFSSDSFTMASTYDFNEGKRKNHYMELNTIYKSQAFVDWKEALLFELRLLKQDEVIGSIIDLLNKFNGWRDERIFRELEAKLKVLMGNIDRYATDTEVDIEDDNRIPEKVLIEKTTRVLSKLQRNHSYSVQSDENTMNDYVRDILEETYEVKDQTRQGVSTNGGDAGEIDIQICENGMPLVMMEGIKLSSLQKENLINHIDKVLTKYDPNGCPYAMVIIYSTAVRFDEFMKKLENYLNEYNFPYERIADIIKVDTGYSEMGHLQTILKRNDSKIRLHIMAAHIV